MRIGDINRNNYTEYAKLFSTLTGGKSNKATPEPFGQRRLLTYDEIEERLRPFRLADPIHYGMPGCDITGKDPSSWQKIVDVSDDIREKMINVARKDFLNNYGLTDGKEMGDIGSKYLLSLPENKRLSAGWTVLEIFRNESQRLTDIVKSKIPGWKNGEPFDRSIFADYLSGSSIYDTKI